MKLIVDALDNTVYGEGQTVEEAEADALKAAYFGDAPITRAQLEELYQEYEATRGARGLHVIDEE